MNGKDVVVNLVKLNGRELNGQTRLQREAYLLDRCGARFELSFAYYYSGPYSFELVDGWEDAEAEGQIEIEEKLGRYDISYLSFKQKEYVDDPDSLGELSAADARERLQKMAEASDTILELAAAIVYLTREGYAERPIEELKMRKPLKATDGRIDKARVLLRDLGLEEGALLSESPAL